MEMTALMKDLFRSMFYKAPVLPWRYVRADGSGYAFRARADLGLLWSMRDARKEGEWIIPDLSDMTGMNDDWREAC